MESSQSTSIHVLIMPQAVVPWVLLALSTLDILANRVGAFTTAIRTDHLTTTNLITFGALQESRSFLTVGEQESNLKKSLFCHLEGFRVFLVDLHGECGSSVSTAGATADGATLFETSCALEVARVPRATGVRVTWVWLARVVIVAVIVCGTPQISLL
jgi:hypothetical protein